MSPTLDLSRMSMFSNKPTPEQAIEEMLARSAVGEWLNGNREKDWFDCVEADERALNEFCGKLAADLSHITRGRVTASYRSLPVGGEYHGDIAARMGSIFNCFESAANGVLRSILHNCKLGYNNCTNTPEPFSLFEVEDDASDHIVLHALDRDEGKVMKYTILHPCVRPIDYCKQLPKRLKLAIDRCGSTNFDYQPALLRAYTIGRTTIGGGTANGALKRRETGLLLRIGDGQVLADICPDHIVNESRWAWFTKATSPTYWIEIAVVLGFHSLFAAGIAWGIQSNSPAIGVTAGVLEFFTFMATCAGLDEWGKQHKTWKSIAHSTKKI